MLPLVWGVWHAERARCIIVIPTEAPSRPPVARTKGPSAARAAWRSVAAQASGAVFVVDALDGLRLPLAAEELGRLVPVVLAQGIPILVLANKQDQVGALPPADVEAALGLPQMASQFSRLRYAVRGASALDAAGLQASLSWLMAASTTPAPVSPDTVTRGAGPGGNSNQI